MPWTYITRLGFTKGIKRTFDPSAVPEDAIWDARNVAVDVSGVLRVRQGIKTFSQPLGSGPVQGAIPAFGDILMAWGRNLYRVNSSGQYTTIGTGVIGAAAQDKTEMIRWSRSGSERVYIFAGNGLYETDGATVSLVTPHTPAAGEQANLLRASDGTQDLNSGPAKCRLAVLRASLGQRIAAAGNPGSPNTVYLSAPLDATYWPADQVIQLPDDGDKITALANWYGALVIFRQRDVWAFFGSSVTAADAALVLQKWGTGCVASRTVVDVPGLGVAFLGPDDVYVLRNVEAVEKMATVEPIGEDIRYYLKDELNSENIAWACGVYHDKHYWLCLPWAKVPVYRLAMQYASGWYPDSNPRTSQFIKHGNALYMAGWESGKFFTLSDSRNDDGLPIPFYIAFKRETLFPGPSKLKRVFVYVMPKARLQLLQQDFFGGAFGEIAYGQADTEQVTVAAGKETSLTLHVVADGQEREANAKPVAVEYAGHASLGSAPPLLVEDMNTVTVYRATVPGVKAHFAQVRLMAGIQDDDFAVLGYVLEYKPRRKIKAKEAEV
jgi:hypothetical protein